MQIAGGSIQKWLGRYKGWLAVSGAMLLTAAGPIVALIEAALVGQIVLNERIFGYGLGLVMYTAEDTLLGYALLAVVSKLWPNSVKPKSKADMEDELRYGSKLSFFLSPVRKAMRWMLTRSRKVQLLVVILWWGPVMGYPFFRGLGYGRRWIFYSALIFCPVWYVFYNGGKEVLWAGIHFGRGLV